MVLNKDETIEIENIKQKNKIEFENLRHKNEMEELNKKLEIAFAGGVKE